MLPKLAEGSEHLVLLDEAEAVVFKLTRPTIYGESYYLVDGVVHQKNCSPLDYLLRLHFWKKVFRSAPQAIGMTPEGQILSQQKYISGAPPSQEAADAFLISAGMKPVKQSCWLWKMEYPEGEYDVWIGDARADNFVENAGGIIPIDLRIWTAPMS